MIFAFVNHWPNICTTTFNGRLLITGKMLRICSNVVKDHFVFLEMVMLMMSKKINKVKVAHTRLQIVGFRS